MRSLRYFIYSAGVLWFDEWNPQNVCHRQGKIFADGFNIIDNPGGVFVIIVIGNFNQDCRSFCSPQLRKRGGRYRRDQFWKRVNQFQVVGNDFCSSFAEPGVSMMRKRALTRSPSAPPASAPIARNSSSS